jgi:hypothetical protein
LVAADWINRTFVRLYNEVAAVIFGGRLLVPG